MGITAATVFAVAPIALPVISNGTETVAMAREAWMTDAELEQWNLLNAESPQGTITNNNDGTYSFTGSIPAIVNRKAGYMPVSNISLKPGETKDFQVPKMNVYKASEFPVGGGIADTYTLSLSDDASKLDLLNFGAIESTDTTDSNVNTGDTTVQVTVKNNTITTKWQSALFTTKGARIKNRALSGNTDWYTDKSAMINGQKMYHVATNEWVAAMDLK